MCSYVGANYNDIDFQKENWFLDYEWSTKDSDDFSTWLVNYLKKNSKARRELMSFPSTRVRAIQKFASHFIFNYGWKDKL